MANVRRVSAVRECVHVLGEKFWSKQLFVTRKAVQKSSGPAREVRRDHGAKKQELKSLAGEGGGGCGGGYWENSPRLCRAETAQTPGFQ